MAVLKKSSLPVCNTVTKNIVAEKESNAYIQAYKANTQSTDQKGHEPRRLGRLGHIKRALHRTFLTLLNRRPERQ